MTGAQTQRRGRTPRAFTLLEVIVAIGIVVVLLAILTPALSGARHSSQVLAKAANLRSLTQTVEIYADAWDDTYPLADTKPFYSPGFLGTTDVNSKDRGRMWYWAMIDAGIVTHNEAFSTSSLDVYNTVYSNTLIHRPDVFRFGAVPSWNERAVSSIRRAFVSYPSQKGTMHLRSVDGTSLAPPFDTAWCCVGNPAGAVSFADASVDIVRRSGLPAPLHPPVGDIGYRVWSTWDGVEGRDR